MRDDNKKEQCYACIDLKSFFASVECVERGLDPMKTDLVVADVKRTAGTICLAVSPSLKQKGVKNRCRLFQIPNKILEQTIIAPPRMQKYIDYAARIYGVYLEFFSKDDLFVYSIDEVFINLAPYLKLYQKSARDLAIFMMEEVYRRIGVRATAGVGTNLYLAKIALDILAKYSPDFVGELTEESYQEKMWDHTPITDFWRIGPGIARNLARHRMFTMRDVARADEKTLYQIFGVDAELIIDHAWGREPVTLADIKAYQPKGHSFSYGQVLPRDYNYQETNLVVREMTRELLLRLSAENQTAGSITMSLGTSFHKGKDVEYVSGTTKIGADAVKSIDALYAKVADKEGYYRRIYLNANRLADDEAPPQRNLFGELFPEEKRATEKANATRKIEKAVLSIRDKHGKSAIMTAEDLEEAGTTRARNKMIGGHQANV